MARNGWKHPDVGPLRSSSASVLRRKEFLDLSLLKGGLSVVKTIEEHQLLGMLAPVNRSNVDRDNAKEMLKCVRGLCRRQP